MEKWQQGVKIFRVTIIYIKQFLDIKVLIYMWLRDLLFKKKNMDNISINKLIFLIFKDTLKQNIGFNKNYNILIYISKVKISKRSSVNRYRRLL